MKNEVEIARYSEVPEAEVARGLLESHEIPCLLQRDDAGGMEPPLHLGEGMTAADIKTIFDGHKPELIELISTISEVEDRVDDSILHQPFDQLPDW